MTSSRTPCQNVLEKYEISAAEPQEDYVQFPYQKAL